MGRIVAAFLVVVSALVVALAADAPPPRADFTWIEPRDIGTLDPQKMTYVQDLRLGSALYEGLVRWDAYGQAFGVIPALARSWEVSSDGLTYTFHLDPAGRWSNGDPVLAGDFVYSWRRAIMPDTAANNAQLFRVIRGVQEFFAWRSSQLAEYAERPASRRTAADAGAALKEAFRRFDETVGVRALDPHTLRVELERPTPYFLDLCGYGPFLPVHPPTVEGFVELDPATGILRQRSGWTKPPRLVCNGPYVLKAWRFKRDMRLERNPCFRDPTLAKSDSLAVLFIEDHNTGFLAFESGAADWHCDLEVEYIGDLLAQKRAGLRDDVHSKRSFGTYFWSFNCTPKLPDGRDNPFHDARVRRAFTLAVDKEALVARVRRSEDRPARTFVPPGSIPGFRSPEGLPHDPARARAELASAGWSDRDGDGVPENARGEPFPVVEMLCTPVGVYRDTALAIGRMWERELGVRSRVVIRENKVFRTFLKRREYMVARGTWIGDYNDPTTFLDLHRTGDGNNDRGFSDPHYDALLAAAENETDPRRRFDILEEAERYTMEEALPILPLWHYMRCYLYRPPVKPDGSPNPGGLRGISMHPRTLQQPHLLEVIREGKEVAR